VPKIGGLTEDELSYPGECEAAEMQSHHCKLLFFVLANYGAYKLSGPVVRMHPTRPENLMRFLVLLLLGSRTWGQLQPLSASE
jgi:hypothetical protein